MKRRVLGGLVVGRDAWARSGFGSAPIGGQCMPSCDAFRTEVGRSSQTQVSVCHTSLIT
jgi:hypothetical protein